VDATHTHCTITGIPTCIFTVESLRHLGLVGRSHPVVTFCMYVIDAARDLCGLRSRNKVYVNLMG
jgi:hypothetical protein